MFRWLLFRFCLNAVKYMTVGVSFTFQGSEGRGHKISFWGGQPRSFSFLSHCLLTGTVPTLGPYLQGCVEVLHPQLKNLSANRQIFNFCLQICTILLSRINEINSSILYLCSSTFMKLKRSSVAFIAKVQGVVVLISWGMNPQASLFSS